MFNIIYSIEKDIKIIKLFGRLTSENVNVFKNYFEQTKDENCRYIFDLQELEFIDSIGLGFIIQTLKYVMAQGGELKILYLTAQPKVIFEITRVDSIFETYESKDEIMKSFKSMENNDASSDTFKQRAL